MASWTVDGIRNAALKITIKEAAAKAGVSTNLVYPWCQEKRVPHYRSGRGLGASPSLVHRNGASRHQALDTHGMIGRK